MLRSQETWNAWLLYTSQFQRRWISTHSIPSNAIYSNSVVSSLDKYCILIYYELLLWESYPTSVIGLKYWLSWKCGCVHCTRIKMKYCYSNIFWSLDDSICIYNIYDYKHKQIILPRYFKKWNEKNVSFQIDLELKRENLDLHKLNGGEWFQKKFKHILLSYSTHHRWCCFRLEIHGKF